MSERLDAEAWLDAGLAALADRGPEGLTIAAIAKRLGVTKGSFYWHFRDLAAYEDALLAAWEHRYTKNVMREADAAGGSAVQRLRYLLNVALETDTRLARGVRHWSSHDARARRARKRVDGQRLEYVTELLRELGWNASDAAALARWTYWAVIGMHATETRTLENADIDLVLRTLEP